MEGVRGERAEGSYIMTKLKRPDAQVCINFDLVPPNGTRLLFEVDRVLMLAMHHAGGSPIVARLVMLLLIMVDVVSVLALEPVSRSWSPLCSCWI